MSRIRSKDTAPEHIIDRLRSQTPRKASTVVLKRTPAAPCTPEAARTPQQGHPPLGQARNLEQAARNLEQAARNLEQAARNLEQGRKLEQARKPAGARAAALSMQGRRQRLRPHQSQPRPPHPEHNRWVSSQYTQLLRRSQPLPSHRPPCWLQGWTSTRQVRQRVGSHCTSS